GSFNCQLIQTSSSATCSPLTQAVAQLQLMRPSRFPLGAVSFNVLKRTRSAPLPAGDYGDVTVERRGDLVLQGGDYTLRSLTVDPLGRVQCQAKCRLHMQGKVLLRQRAVLGPAAPLEGR